MVYGGRYCIDSTEVTAAQYAAFLADMKRSPGIQPPVCAFNVAYDPSDLCLFDSDSRPNAPVVGVDWCDAYAFCAWSGKHLCGQIGGGGLSVAPDFDATRAAWYAACTNNGDGKHAFPYGNDYNTTICNGYDQRPITVSGLEDVKSNPGCVGGLPGLYDMSGNAWEWEDACQPPNGGESDSCLRRGASYTTSTGDQTSCKAWQLTPRKTRQCDIGFRCCTDVN
jgi:formylglycine-generating enzyme required for sulfatase activity